MLESLDEIVVPESFRAEVVNVLWPMVQHADVDISLAHEALDDTNAFIEVINAVGAAFPRVHERGFVTVASRWSAATSPRRSSRLPVSQLSSS